jgi:hypothetical protein
VNADTVNKSLAVEGHLSQLWGLAGVAMLSVNEELAQLYVMKADYWSDRDGWEAKKKDTVLIELDEVFRLGCETLFGK